MEISYIKKIIKLVENSDIDEIEIDEEGKKLRVARTRHNAAAQQIMLPPVVRQSGNPSESQHSTPQESKPLIEPAASENQYHEVRSPIVGTFYRAPTPEAEPYVEIGHQVKTGAVLCIVEAMKLMNEIESDADGKIVKIMVENGKPVEYNQVLFLVEKA
ncbi:MAG: acetyl-CoA carboxylase biotin carboxyl carrier protein [Bacteroidota bacterium]